MIKTISRDCPLSPKEYLSISGGIFHDCAVHDVDMVTWVLGEYPSEVFAAASAHIPEIRETGDYDTIAIMLKFPSGQIEPSGRIFDDLIRSRPDFQAPSG